MSEIVNMFDHIKSDDSVRFYLILLTPCDQVGRVSANDYVRSDSENFTHLFYCLYGVGIPIYINDFVDSEHFCQNTEKTASATIVYHNDILIQ